jgi:hypothetical protein
LLLLLHSSLHSSPSFWAVGQRGRGGGGREEERGKGEASGGPELGPFSLGEKAIGAVLVAQPAAHDLSRLVLVVQQSPPPTTTTTTTCSRDHEDRARW